MRRSRRMHRRRRQSLHGTSLPRPDVFRSVNQNLILKFNQTIVSLIIFVKRWDCPGPERSLSGRKRSHPVGNDGRSESAHYGRLPGRTFVLAELSTEHWSVIVNLLFKLKSIIICAISAGHIIDMTSRSSALRASCLEETAGHGVDLILDLGCSQYPIVNGTFIFSYWFCEFFINLRIFLKGRLCGEWADPASETWRHIVPGSRRTLDHFATGSQCKYWLWMPKLCFILNIWICAKLDSNNSRLLWLKCASVGYLNEHSWVLSPAQAGRYQHILLDIMDKLADRSLRFEHVGNY